MKILQKIFYTQIEPRNNVLDSSVTDLIYTKSCDIIILCIFCLFIHKFLIFFTLKCDLYIRYHIYYLKLYLTRILPVISFGISKFIIFNIVGAISPNFPSNTS